VNITDQGGIRLVFFLFFLLYALNLID
jgi:hypothetical protein